MKKTPFFTLIVLIILFAFLSCRKVYDFVHAHPDAIDSFCRISNITVLGPSGILDTVEVTYNSKDNPILLGQINQGPFSGNYDQHFRYDKFDRLTDYILTFTGISSVVVWEKYAYQNNSSIKVIDTVMVGVGTADANSPAPNASDVYFYTITGYTFDAHDRIWQRWSMPRASESGQKPQFLFAYVYDANGNAANSDTTVMYDNEVNVYRTNKVWQLIYENYSRNNLIPVRSSALAVYNEFGLPVSLPNAQTKGDPTEFDLANFDPVMNIQYACSMPKGPINY